MSALSPILRKAEGDHLVFWCPGCNRAHMVRHGGGGWTWNGDVNKPTFTPSVLVRSGHYAPELGGCWCEFNRGRIAKGEEPSGFTCGVCHSFVTDGRIQFLGDCTHALAGQTVDIPEWPAEDKE